MHKLTIKKVGLFVASGLLILTIAIFSLEKLHITDLYKKPIKKSNATISGIDYSPATDTDKTYNDQIKQNLSDPTNDSQPISVTLTRATQNPENKSLIVRAIISGITTGTCTLDIYQNNDPPELTKQSAVLQQNSIYTCSGFDVPQSELPGLGEWAIKVTVTNGEKSASAVQTVMLEK